MKKLFIIITILTTVIACQNKTVTNDYTDSYCVNLTLDQYPEWSVEKCNDYIFMDDYHFIMEWYGVNNEIDRAFELTTNSNYYIINNTHIPSLYIVIDKDNNGIMVSKREFYEWYENTIHKEKFKSFTSYTYNL